MTSASPATSTSPFKRAGPLTFAFLFAGESLLRALNVSVIPLQARELLGSSQKVSVVATCVSAAVLLTTLSLPYLLRNLRRRWTYSLGIALIVTAAALFASYTIPGQILGHYLRNTGAAVLNVTLSLYIMDHIRKEDLTHSEPLRLAVSTVSWVVGPATGTWLFTYYGSLGAQATVFLAGLLLLTGFWVARLSDPNALVSGTIAAANPFTNAWAFFRQPRLRLAWSIAFARSCFWSGVFIYGPLLIVEGGLANTQAGYVISATQLMLPMSLIYGRIARKSGVRPVVATCFAAVALFTCLAGLFGSGHIVPAIVCLLLASFSATGLDGVGGVPFLRSVKPRQRRAMTSVYRTFFEAAELLPGIVYSLVLLYFDVGAVFVLLSGLSLLLCALSWRYLPKSM
jgi:MFS family permease